MCTIEWFEIEGVQSWFHWCPLLTMPFCSMVNLFRYFTTSFMQLKSPANSLIWHDTPRWVKLDGVRFIRLGPIRCSPIDSKLFFMDHQLRSTFKCKLDFKLCGVSYLVIPDMLVWKHQQIQNLCQDSRSSPFPFFPLIPPQWKTVDRFQVIFC